MNMITEPLRQLVRRKLWPIALLLVGALVAVPLTLAEEPAPTVPAGPRVSDEEGLPATFVSLAEEGEENGRRRVLGIPKDPFAPRALTKAEKAARKKAEKAAQAEKTSSETASGGRGAETSGGGGGGGGGGSAPAPEPPAGEAPKAAPAPPKYSIKVSFGPVDSELQTQTVERLMVLPDEDNPLMVYRGVEKNGKVAVFELTGSVTAQGDGDCEPAPEDCQVLRLRAGETQFLSVAGDEGDVQYQLNLHKIHAGKAAAKSKLSKAEVAGRNLLRKWARKRPARYAFDAETGTLRKLDTKAAKSLSLSARRASL